MTDQADQPRRRPRPPAGTGRNAGRLAASHGVDDPSRRTGYDEDRPARRVRQAAPRPNLPRGVDVDLPRAARRELRSHVRGKELADEVAVAVMLAGEAIDADDGEAALPYLEWAKQVAPRSAVIRESLGVARYLIGDFKAALNELRTYRRLSGSSDQDHLIADCLRANGASTAQVAETVEALLDSDAPGDRRLEALLVWAGSVADTGDVAAAQAVLRRATRSMLDDAGEEGRDRLTYMVGRLAEQSGDRDRAVAAFSRLADLDDDPYDVRDRLAALRPD